ncbi:hypothetical protein F4802DRAFT_620776 [Xylaria palmicola]|nr:hypothetical protein F4802DRAFT_620776 [Xylaria palmicola]
MSSTSFTLFPRFPAELQLEVWEQSLGPPRIHMLLPAPETCYHWLQDFACPVHQVIDPTTGAEVKERPLERFTAASACKIAHDVIAPKSLRVTLSHFDPRIQPGSLIPTQPEDEIYFRDVMIYLHGLAHDLNDVAQVFRLIFSFGDFVPTILVDSTDAWRLLLQTYETAIPPNPESVSAKVRVSIAAIQAGIEDFRRALDQWLETPNGAGVFASTEEPMMRLHDEVDAFVDALTGHLVPPPVDSFLLRAPEFRQGETQRAMQSFVIAADRDLVYISDAQHYDLFLRLWQAPWCKKIERLALLVCDTDLCVEYSCVDLDERLRAVWDDPDAFFDGTSLKEILLVAKPKDWTRYTKEGDDHPTPMFERDMYGFVDYKEIGDYCEAEYVDLVMPSLSVEQIFMKHEAQLKKMFPKNLGREIKIRWVVDVACDATDLLETEDGTYRIYHRRL